LPDAITRESYCHLSDAGSKYENFLLVVAYWLGPWLGVVFADKFLHRNSNRNDAALIQDKSYMNWAGLVGLAIGMPISIWLFSNQAKYVGKVVEAHPSFGDITFLVGAILSGGIYALLSTTILKPSATVPLTK
jgi:NCS1 family nucleobase:cation symporter-1